MSSLWRLHSEFGRTAPQAGYIDLGQVASFQDHASLSWPEAFHPGVSVAPSKRPRRLACQLNAVCEHCDSGSALGRSLDSTSSVKDSRAKTYCGRFPSEENIGKVSFGKPK